jgi:hypothetical protein
VKHGGQQFLLISIGDAYALSLQIDSYFVVRSKFLLAEGVLQNQDGVKEAVRDVVRSVQG